jgi:hypothetical protein
VESEDHNAQVGEGADEGAEFATDAGGDVAGPRSSRLVTHAHAVGLAEGREGAIVVIDPTGCAASLCRRR